MQKPKLIILSMIVLVALASMAYEQFSTPAVFSGVRTAQTASFKAASVPALSFKTLDGRVYALNDMKEKGVLLHFWASWCTTCLLEFPALLKTSQSFGEDVALVVVSIDDSEEAMNRFRGKLEKHKPDLFNNPHLYWVWDQDKTLSIKHFNAVRVPETVFINKDRMMTDKIAGKLDWSSDETKAKIKALIAE